MEKLMEKLCEGYGLIEGPVWDDARGLIFSDVVFGGVFALSQSGQVSEIFAHRKGIGGMAIHEAGGLIVSGRNIAFKAFGGGDTKIILDRNEAEGNLGYNDITTDAQGRIYAGSLGVSTVFEDDRKPQSGDLYLIDLDGSARIVAPDVRLTNGLGFSPDGKILYHSDSGRKSVYCYQVNDDGSLGEKQLFVTAETGTPDGLVVSEDGRLWLAQAGRNAGVGVYDAQGKLTELIKTEGMCTSVCFGGPERKSLYMVTGSEDLGSDQRDGAVYRMSTDVAGVPVAPAKVKLPG
ncbi:MAG: SMP-30/gluconolactonase/LRE family protein [Porticoccaceae bacterium]|nr:SMP-30/gluconolactonase/LRE family protein [Porticoccaceae bacterium]